MGTIKWKIMGDDQEYFTDEEMHQNAKDDYSKFGDNVRQEHVAEDSLRVEDYELDDMVVDDNVRVCENEENLDNVYHMVVDSHATLEETNEQVNANNVGDDSVGLDRSNDQMNGNVGGDHMNANLGPEKHY